MNKILQTLSIVILIFFSFSATGKVYDENDIIDSKFNDKGSLNLDLSIVDGSVPPVLEKHWARYNQCLEIQDRASSSYALSNVSATGLSVMKDGYTVEFWFRYDDVPANYQSIIQIVGSGKTVAERTFMLYISSASLVHEFADNSTGVQKQSTVAISEIDDGLWHHIACTWDGTYLKIYIDFQLKSTSSDFSSFQPYNTPSIIEIGEMEFNAYIDELMIFDFPKEPEEFGTINIRDYQFGQWYSKAEVEILEGKMIRK